MKRLLALWVTVLALGGAVKVAAQKDKAEIVVEQGIVYGKGGDTKLELDLAMPKNGAGPFPTVIFLHGGGWRHGNRQQMVPFIKGMASAGYVSVTPSYRLVPSAAFPAQIEDCKAAVRWLRANAKKYKVDPDRIGVVGFSAGGHLASLLGAADKTAGLEGSGGNADQSSRVQAVVSFAGPTDFTTRDWPKELEMGLIVPFLGGTFADRTDVYKKASPITYVTKGAPPFLILHGTKDELVPVDQARRMAKKLESAGAPVRLVIYEGEGHGFKNETNQKAIKLTVEFLVEKLKK